jgi:hypothetical protein
MKLDTIRRYALGSSPIIGLPVFSVAEGKHITAIFKREHFIAALSAPIVRAHYDEKEHLLVLNGGPRTCYKLRNLSQVQGFAPWQVREQLSRWAAGRKKSVKTRGLDPNQKRVIKLRAQIAKLERAKDKIHAQSPHSPMKLPEWDRTPASASARGQELRWRAEKPMRRKLGRLVRQERKTWADFYRQVEEIIGPSVDSSERHDRVCNRKDGPDRLDYLKYIYRHIWMARKPYERESVWNPFKVYEWAGEDHGLNRFQQHRRAQVEYLATMRERAALDSLIEGHREQIQNLTSGSI